MIRVYRRDCPASGRPHYDGRCCDGKTYDYANREYECSECDGLGYILAIDEEELAEAITKTLQKLGLIQTA